MLIVYTHIYYIVVHISYTYNILYMYYIYIWYIHISTHLHVHYKHRSDRRAHVDKMDMDCTYFWQNKTKTGGSTVWLALGCFLQKIENNNESKQREERERERERDEGNLSDSNELTATWASQKQSKSKYQTFWTALILHCRWFAVLGPLLKEFLMLSRKRLARVRSHESLAAFAFSRDDSL